MSNPHVCSIEKSKSKRVNFNACSMEDSESKRFNVNTCSTDKSESKIVHEMDIRVNMSEVKDTKVEEPPVTDIFSIWSTGCFKLFECDK